MSSGSTLAKTSRSGLNSTKRGFSSKIFSNFLASRELVLRHLAQIDAFAQAPGDRI
jgi:hypothetical protein